ncbi:hypothetical protein C2R22_02575 [Salinigranum rubrum]|uniref:DUF7511 domain-containing protein n=1 Tax=Salinigranum rubrum TaxID=755307 RepID=A0A2I8VFH7_9EURY|nr:hypothetical protein [Salinigranum rubrum]AUV80676.1 hypothetical protein C2R22_02575 [Salinigranum rubrum]
MTDTNDCDTDAVGKGRDAAPFGLDLGPEPDADAETHVCGHLEEYDDAPDEYTIFPRVASEELPRTTAWLTAQEGSYLSLDEYR